MKYKLEYEHKEKDFEDVWNIENEYLDSSIISDIKQTIMWNQMNKDTHIFVRDISKDKIVGEATILPLTEKQFKLFMNNELDDTDIDKIIEYKPNIECYLLFSVIAISKQYRNEKIILSLLLEGVNKKIDSLINNGVKFLNMCAEGATSDGIKFIDSFLNLKYQKDTKDGYKLYSFDSKEDFNIWKKTFPSYIDKYKKNHSLDYLINIKE